MWIQNSLWWASCVSFSWWLIFRNSVWDSGLIHSADMSCLFIFAAVDFKNSFMLWSDAISSGRSLLTFQKKLCPPSSECYSSSLKQNSVLLDDDCIRLMGRFHTRLAQRRLMATYVLLLHRAQKIKKWKPMSKRPIARPKTRWEDDVWKDIKSKNISNWEKVA